MLVLSRKSQEQIRIGNDITISILKIKGQVVSVGVDAPRSVRIVRGELAVFSPEEEKAASRVPATTKPAITAAATNGPATNGRQEPSSDVGSVLDGDTEPQRSSLKAFVKRRRSDAGKPAVVNEQEVFACAPLSP